MMKNEKANLANYKKWLERKDLSINTIDNYLQAINRYGKNKKLTTTNLRNYIKANVRKYQPSTLLTRIRALLSYANFQGLTNIEWQRVLKLVPKYQHKYFPTVNLEEVNQIKQARYETNNWVYERNSLIIDFLTYTGIRVSELVNIQLTDYNGNNQLKVHGKGNKVRYVFVPDFLVAKLENKYSNKYLFTNCKGKPLTRMFIADIIQLRRNLSGINKIITPHSFRRSFATALNNTGTRLTTIQRLLGHAQIASTVSYIHNDMNSLFAEYKKTFIES